MRRRWAPPGGHARCSACVTALARIINPNQSRSNVAIFAVRQPEIRVEQHDQPHSLWPEVGARGAQRLGCLQQVPPLHAATTVAAAADMHAKPAHVGPHYWQLFLDVIGDARLGQRAAAPRTVPRQRHVDRFVNVRRRLSMSVPTVAPNGAATRRLRIGVGAPFENGAAWRLPARRAASKARVRRSLSRRNRSRSRLSCAFSSRRRARSCSDCSISRRNRSNSRRASSIDVGVVRFGTRLICQNLVRRTRGTR